MIEFELDSPAAHSSPARIKVIGIGGAGCNTVNSMLKSGYENVEFITINTDAQALKKSQAPIKVQIGTKSTKGLGAGANPDLGKKAAEEDLDLVLKAVENADVVFLTGGLGGGTGSGALPVIAKALKAHDVLTITIVTKPFDFEGKKRCGIAEQALVALQKEADTLLVIPNQKLLALTDNAISLINAFDMINNLINQSVRSIADIITKPGHINVDFADVKAIMKNQGMALMGTGKATGADRAQKAAKAAISSPLLENISIQGARGVLINITSNANLGLHELSAAAEVIYAQAHEDATIIVGSVIDDAYADEIAVTVIATGFLQKVAETVTAATSTPFNDKLYEKYQELAHSTPEVVAKSSVAKSTEDRPVLTQQAPVAKPAAPVAAPVSAPAELKSNVQEISVNTANPQDLEIPTLLRRIQEKRAQQKN